MALCFHLVDGILKCANFFLRVIDRSLLETETKRKAMIFFSFTIEGIISVVNPFINESNWSFVDARIYLWNNLQNALQANIKISYCENTWEGTFN